MVDSGESEGFHPLCVIGHDASRQAQFLGHAPGNPQRDLEFARRLPPPAGRLHERLQERPWIEFGILCQARR